MKTQLALSLLEGNSPLPAINWMRVSKGEVFVAASCLSFEEPLEMHLVFLSQAFVRISLWDIQDMPDVRDRFTETETKYSTCWFLLPNLYSIPFVFTYIYIYTYDYMSLIVLYSVSMS